MYLWGVQEEVLEITEPGRLPYRVPRANKDNVIKDLTLRGVIASTKIRDVVAEAKLEAQKQAFLERQKQTGGKNPVVKIIDK